MPAKQQGWDGNVGGGVGREGPFALRCEQRGRRATWASRGGGRWEECWSDAGRDRTARGRRGMRRGWERMRCDARVGAQQRDKTSQSSDTLAITSTTRDDETSHGGGKRHEVQGRQRRLGMDTGQSSITREARLNNPTGCPIHCHPRLAELGPPSDPTGTCCPPGATASRGGGGSRGLVPGRYPRADTPKSGPWSPLRASYTGD